MTDGEFKSFKDGDLETGASWTIKIDEGRPKHFIKFIGHCITPDDHARELPPKSLLNNEFQKPLESLKAYRTKNRIQLGVKERFLATKDIINPLSTIKGRLADNTKDLHGDEEEVPEDNQEVQDESNDYVESGSSSVSETSSDLESELSRSVLGLMRQAMTMPRVKHQLLTEIAGSNLDLTGLELSPLEKLKLQKARSIQPPEEIFGPRDKMSPELFVQKVIEQNGIVVFGSSKCSFCARLQYILEMHERNYTMLRLDKMDSYGKQISDYLSANWMELNVPNIYFHGAHIDSNFVDKDLNSELVGLNLVSLDPSLYDLIVIGGGLDGCAAAIKAAELKKKVCLIDCIDTSCNRPFWVLGKTGLNIGSIPKRYLYQAALDCIDLCDSKHYGWNDQNFWLKWSSLVNDIWRELKRKNWEYRINLRKAGVTYLNCQAKLIDRHTLEVMNRETKKFTLKSKYILLTLGAQAYIPKISGGEYCITSDEVFLQQRIPGKVLIFGGSTVAVEYAFILRQLGFPTALMVPGTLMRNIDREIVDLITKRMEHLGIEIFRECLLVGVEPIMTSKLSETEEGSKPIYYGQLSKNQLVELSEDYIRLQMTDIESNAQLDVNLNKYDDRSGEIQVDGRKPRDSKCNMRQKMSENICQVLNTSPKAEPFDAPQQTKNKYGVRRDSHDSEYQEHELNILNIPKTDMEEQKSLKRNLLVVKTFEGKKLYQKGKQKDVISNLNSNRLKKKTIIPLKTNSYLDGMKRRSIFSHFSLEHVDGFTKGENVQVNSVSSRSKISRRMNDSSTLISLIKHFRNDGQNTNKASINILTKSVNHNTKNTFDGIKNTFDGPKGKGKKGKDKKGKGKKGKGMKGKKKSKKIKKPVESESQKAVRENNENLLRLLTKIITTQKLAGAEPCVPDRNAKEINYDGQPNFSVIGLYGNGSFYRGDYNTIIIASGDETNSGNIGLTKVGININPGTGKVYTNTNDQTDVQNIYAVGDIVEGKSMDKSTSVSSAINVVKRLFTGKKKRIDHLSFSDLLLLPPSEYSYIGLSEGRARDTLPGVIHVYKKWFRPLETIFSHRNTARSFLKVIAHVERPRMEKVVGMHVFGRNAVYTIQGFTMAMKKGLYVHELQKLIATDLTNAERLTSIELEEEERQIYLKEEGDTREAWEEELKELQEIHSFQEELPIEEEEEPPEEIVIALERLISEEAVPEVRKVSGRGTSST